MCLFLLSDEHTNEIIEANHLKSIIAGEGNSLSSFLEGRQNALLFDFYNIDVN
jgi:hypothetical protein